MQYILLSTIIIIAIVFTLQAQPLSPFEKATESTWYPHFLNPVMDTIEATGEGLKILDLGTGTGKLPELLINRNPCHHILAIDIDTAYIHKARRRFQHPHVRFEYQALEGPLPIKDESFDVVSICSVLFLVDEKTRGFLFSESLRILKPGGKILVLTPSGKKSRLSALQDAKKFWGTTYGWTYVLWRQATKCGGKIWTNEQWIKQQLIGQELTYSSTLVFEQNAVLEVITKR